MRRKLTDSDARKIIRLYTKKAMSPAMIAERFGVSRQGVWKLLRRNGVNTSDTRVVAQCSHCGKEVLFPRARFRRTINPYCSRGCYAAAIRAGKNYVAWRQGCRIARARVGRVFPLPDGAVVHHKNGDNTDNRIENLAVFASSGAHMSHHRGGRARPLWDGADHAPA